MHKNIYPKQGTKALQTFILSHISIEKLFNFILFNTADNDKMAEVTQGVIEILVEGESEKQKLIEPWKNRKKSLDGLKENRQLLLELFLVRYIENFINFLSALLYEMFLACPNALKSSEKIEIERILEYSNMNELIKSIAEQKVDSISYSSFSKINDFYINKFGICISDDTGIKIISDSIEIRNISVHNRCIINNRYVQRVGIEKTYVGQKKKLVLSDINKFLPLIVKTSIELDKNARKKLGIRAIRYKKEA